MSIPTRQEILFRNKTIILVLYFILACILSECNDFHRTIVKFPKIIQEIVAKKGSSFSAIALFTIYIISRNNGADRCDIVLEAFSRSCKSPLVTAADPECD